MKQLAPFFFLNFLIMTVLCGAKPESSHYDDKLLLFTDRLLLSSEEGYYQPAEPDIFKFPPEEHFGKNTIEKPWNSDLIGIYGKLLTFVEKHQHQKSSLSPDSPSFKPSKKQEEEPKQLVHERFGTRKFEEISSSVNYQLTKAFHPLQLEDETDAEWLQLQAFQRNRQLFLLFTTCGALCKDNIPFSHSKAYHAQRELCFCGNTDLPKFHPLNIHLP